ncbi:hypothetical protein [Acaryochloris sp. IP29b_bin.137]|uniref:hypothetical protein n=1 Tax=Acaryochloris sp. IP29b_bin.137 TaxID=2969217 RepID=UPI00262DE4C8|nr:hypothetical protein [Acaryochloris sp. IP29b_bin.137]
MKYAEEDFTIPEVKELMRKNDRFGKEYAEIHGLSTSTRQGSQWETEFTVEEQKNLLKE